MSEEATRKLAVDAVVESLAAYKKQKRDEFFAIFMATLAAAEPGKTYEEISDATRMKIDDMKAAWAELLEIEARQG